MYIAMDSDTRNSNSNSGKTPVWLYFLLMGLMLVWGYSFVAIKELLTELSAIDLTVIRFLFVFIAIVIFMMIDFSRGKSWPRLDKRLLWKFVLLGFLGVVAYHVALNIGEQYTTATVASIIVFTAPVFTLILARVMLNEKITLTKGTGVVIALIGVLVIVLIGKDPATLNLNSIKGGFIVLISPISWALYTVLSKRYTDSSDSIEPLYLSLYTMLFGSLILLFFIKSGTISALLSLSFKAYINIFILSIVSSFSGYIIWVFSLKYMEASRLSVFLYLIPVYTYISSEIFLEEPITFPIIFGSLLVFLGIWLAEKKK